MKMISPDLDQAQRIYISLTNTRISQTELQRLSAALAGGMPPDAAAQSVYNFFAEPIDWETERAAFAKICADRRVNIDR